MPVDDARIARPVLVVGHGLIGASVHALMLAGGIPVVCVRLRRTGAPGFRAHDLSSGAGREALAATVHDLHPRCVVLVHGPGDVTWIERNPADAIAVHCEVAASVARSGEPAVLVSTDNVFPGTRGGHRPDDPVEPCNAYGRIKAQAERAVLASGVGMVLRVSLAYGWTGPTQRSTFAQRCLDAAAEGRPMSAPTDQMFTPVHVRDVATVIAGLCRSPVPLAGIRHLAGPTELSRHEFARLAYRLAGADTALVRPCLRQDTEWACRPRFSSLVCGDFADLPGLATWRPMAPGEGLLAMLATPPARPWDADRQPARHGDAGGLAAGHGGEPR